METKIETYWGLFKRYASFLAVLVLAYYLFKTCSSNQELSTANAVNEAKIEFSKELVNREYARNEKLDKANQKYKDSLLTLKSEKEKLKSEIIIIKQVGENIINEAKSYDTKAYTNYFKDRYSEYASGISQTDLGVVFTDIAINPVVNDLITGDVAKAELKITKEVLVNEEKQGIVKDSIIGNREQKISAQGIIISEKDKQQDLTNQTVKNQELQIKKLSVKNTILNIGIPAAIVTGFLAGLLTAN